MEKASKWEYYQWGMICISVILSIVPLFMVGTPQKDGIPSGEFSDLFNSTSSGRSLDDVAFYAATDDAVALPSSIDFAKVMAPFLGMALPVMMDVIVDIYAYITQPRRTLTTNLMRLSLLERAVFVVGLFVNGLFLLFPSSWNPMILFTIQYIFANVNTLLTVAPMLMFMERNTDVFTPLVTTLLLILLCSGILAVNFTILLVADSASLTYNALYQYSVVSLSICFGGIILACVWSLFCYLSSNGWFYQSWHTSTTDKTVKDLDPYEEFSVYKVPALHMIALTTMCVINIYWFNKPTIIPMEQVSLLNLLLLISTSLVLTIEMRVRQNEVMHGLFLLDSKKSFVRFISHEVRTPLSTALMGLELLGVDLQSTACDETDVEHMHSSSAIASLPQEDVEALQLVHESLKVAASIFDNLAEYDALGHEDQKMDLNITSLNIAMLIRQIVRPLQLQARRNNVEMLVDCLDAMIDVDQRRMSQAIRALISTAIALTSKKGTVTISMRLINVETYDDTSPKNYVSSGPGLVGKRKNTVQFMKRASIVSSTIFATSAAESDVALNPTFVVLEIHYDGSGFDKTDARRANKKMFSFDPRELHGGGASGYGTGSGLGLALAKFIADAHGGRLWVESEGIGKGERLAMGIPLSTTNLIVPTNISNVPRTIPERHMEYDVGSDTATDVYLSTKQDSDKKLSRPMTSEMCGISMEGGNHLPLRELAPSLVINRNARLILSLPETLTSGPSTERGNQHPSELIPLDFNRLDSSRHVRKGLPLAESLSSGQSTERAIGTGILHVLVVEDSAVARGMLVRMMRSLKCTTAEAADGVEAVSMVQASINRNNDGNHGDTDIENGQTSTRAFDLILCDSVMPNMAGPEAVQQIRAMGFTNPIIGVTGNTLPEQVDDFIAHGVNAVLPKPVHFRSLKDAIGRNLEGKTKETFLNSINRTSRNTLEFLSPGNPGIYTYREESSL